MEQDNPTGRFLLYSPTEEPDYEDDWLLDIRLYSRSFRADRASLILAELGLESQHLREHLATHSKFFDHKDRLQKLKSLVSAFVDPTGPTGLLRHWRLDTVPNQYNFFQHHIHKRLA